jgi:ATP-binding cassette subfamily B protein
MEILLSTSRRERQGIIITSLSYLFENIAKVLFILTTIDMIKYLTQGHGVLSKLSHYWIAFAFLTALKLFGTCMADLYRHYVGFYMDERLHHETISKLKKFSLGFFTSERAGDLSTIFNNDIRSVQAIAAHSWARILSDVIVSLILGVVILVIDYRLFLPMVILLPIGVHLLVSNIKMNKSIDQEVKANHSDMLSLFVEYTKGIPVLKSFTENKKIDTALVQSAEKFGESNKVQSNFIAGYTAKYKFILDLGFFGLIMVGGLLLLNGSLSIMTYIMTLLLAQEFYKPFNQLEDHITSYVKAETCYSKIAKILNQKPIIDEKANKSIDNFNIAFKKAYFSYGSEFEMKNMNLDIKEREMVALVGPSGSGKSTLANLILRFYDLDKGHLTIGGKSIKEVDYDELLDHISIVMQNVVLFSDTILENIRFGNKKATKEQVIHAAKEAMIHDFIMTLPDGYDTVLNENGSNLSGGQKQRLSIARAFIKASKIVILDEATSNVDPINERKIQKAISNLAKGRTVIVIAHHLSTIRSADKIVVLNDGQIKEQGNFDDLIAKQGLFKKLWDAQQISHNWKINKKAS